MSAEPAWKLRFTAPRLYDFTVAADAPDRWAAVTNESGSWQAWSWDRATGERTRVSTEGIGAEEVHLTPDGTGVVWWRDDSGDERGHWVVSPFGGGEGRPLLPDLADGWTMGISLVGSTVAAGLATDEEYRVVVAEGGGPARELYRHERPAGVGAEWPQGAGGLSADASLLCIRHAEHGDIERQALRILDVGSGATVADLDDSARTGASGWSPVRGDPRLAGWSEVSGFERPFVWNARTDERDDLDVPLDAAVFPLDWYPDGGALLLRHAARGYDALYRFDLRDGALAPVLDPHGTVNAAWVRPDGRVWAWVETSAEPPRIVDDRGEEVASLGSERQPGGRAFRSFTFRNPSGDDIQGFVVTPEGGGPFATILSVHGGPNWHHTDAFDPDAQAFVDHGYAVVLVNFRGSTGYGTSFRDALQGNIGFPESEDVNAALDALIAAGVVDPDRVCIEGWSWGGYLATLNAGLRPERWRAVLAGIPVGDYVAAHYECAPALRAWDLAVMGGSPMDLPELYAERNPMTYVDRVQAPVLMIAGEHDSRCPLGQVMVYAHALRVRGGDVEVHTYPGGHHALATEDKLRHVEMTIAFFDRALGDGAPPRSF